MNPFGISDAQLALRIGARTVLVLAALALLASPGVGAACECLNNATAIDFDADTGGTDGQFSERVTVNGPINQTWTVTAATGAFDAFDVPPVGTRSPLVPIATDGSVLLLQTSPGVYVLDLVFVESLGYEVSVSNGRGTTLKVGNNCRYPDPVFSPAIASQYQSSAAPVTLGAVSASGPPLASTTFTIDAVAQTQLTPSSLAVRPAVHTVELLATGSEDGEYKACEQGGRKTFAVITSRAAPAIGAAWGSALIVALSALGVFALRRRAN